MYLIKFHLILFSCSTPLVSAKIWWLLTSGFGFAVWVCRKSKARLATTQCRISVTGESCYIHTGKDIQLDDVFLFAAIFKAVQLTELVPR